MNKSKLPPNLRNNGDGDELVHERHQDGGMDHVRGRSTKNQQN